MGTDLCLPDFSPISAPVCPPDHRGITYFPIYGTNFLRLARFNPQFGPYMESSCPENALIDPDGRGLIRKMAFSTIQLPAENHAAKRRTHRCSAGCLCWRTGSQRPQSGSSVNIPWHYRLPW